MTKELPPLPCLTTDGDSLIIYLVPVGTKKIRIIDIHRFRNNQNTEAVSESFSDLNLETKRLVIHQINRRHVGRTVLTS